MNNELAIIPVLAANIMCQELTKQMKDLVTINSLL